MVVDYGILMDPAGIALDLYNHTAFVADQAASCIWLVDMEHHKNENPNASFVYKIIDDVTGGYTLSGKVTTSSGGGDRAPPRSLRRRARTTDGVRRGVFRDP